MVAKPKLPKHLRPNVGYLFGGICYVVHPEGVDFYDKRWNWVETTCFSSVTLTLAAFMRKLGAKMMSRHSLVR